MNFSYLNPKKGLKLFNRINLSLVKENPGVYIYFSKEKTPIYIGKAKRLKRRIKSYKSTKLIGKTKVLIGETKYFTTIEVNSELESLLLEAYLVRKHKPTYNVQLKDDKNPLYIKITKEKYPRIFTVRKIDIVNDRSKYFGPFPKTSAVKLILTQLRKIFPYSQHNIGKRPCIYSQINLCSPCPNVIEQTKDQNLQKELIQVYLENIKHIKQTLSGQIISVRNILNNELLSLSKKENYENANIVKDKIEKYDYITQPTIPIRDYLKNPNIVQDVRENELKNLARILTRYANIDIHPNRIECYDIAHISGSFPTASMVTFIKGEPDKHFYRHFKIRQESGADDIASLNEVAKRRSKHFDNWGIPDLVIVDGGKGQTRTIYDVFSTYNIPVIGIAKRSDSLIFSQEVNRKLKFIQIKIKPSPGFHLIKRMRDESHRFARRYHHKLIKNYLIPKDDI